MSERENALFHSYSYLVIFSLFRSEREREKQEVDDPQRLYGVLRVRDGKVVVTWGYFPQILYVFRIGLSQH